MFRLNDPVHLGIVARDSNVTDAISRGKDVESSNVGGSVIGNQVGECSPLTEDILEDEIGYNFG